VVKGEAYNEKELLFRVSQGDEKAFRIIFEQHWDRIYSVAFMFSKSSPFAEELVQDIFVKIWRNRSVLPTINQFDGYLFTVARNEILNQLRRKIQEEPLSAHLSEYFRETSALPSEGLMLKETIETIRKVVETLPPQQQMVFRLSREQGLSHEEIARKMQISSLTVKSHLTKALRTLRTFLEKPSFSIMFLLSLFR
jgi:RNA polymerase sigma-70 factor (ECF subfamily)